MKVVEEVRRLRLAELYDEYGSYAKLNALLDRDKRDSGLSQIANKSANSKGGSGKVMGSDVARKLETACSKPEGWMDTDPEQFWPFRFSTKHWHALDDVERGMVEKAALSEIERILGDRSGEGRQQKLTAPFQRRA